MENYINSIQILLFCITFFFTMIRFISNTRLFETSLKNLPQALGYRENRFWVIMTWMMWCYQIYFWFHHFHVI